MSNLLAKREAARLRAEKLQREKEEREREEAAAAARAKAELEAQQKRIEEGRREAERKAAELERQTKRYVNGGRYIGEFKDGFGRIPHGYGEFIRSDGSTQYDGNWANGLMHGIGTYTWENDDSWEGSFMENDLHGQGLYVFADRGLPPRTAIYRRNKRVCWLDELEGAYIEVKMGNAWHRGIVTAYDETTTRHCVQFDLNKARKLYLRKEHFRVLRNVGNFALAKDSVGSAIKNTE